MTHLDRKELAKLVKLKQAESVWLCSVRLTNMRIGESDDQVIQPYIILVIDATEGMARSFELCAEGKPDADLVAEVLAKAMYAPMSDAPPEFSSVQQDLAPLRPQRVLIDDVALVESLKPAFEEAGVEVNFHAELTPIDQFLQMFDQLSQPNDTRLPLLEIPGVRAPMLAELFDASTQFFKREVWDDLDNADVIQARYPALQGKDYFLSIMGMGRQEFGIAIYESVEDLNATFNIEDPDNPLAAMATMRAMNFSFSGKEGVLAADLAAFKKNKWAKPERNTYLAPMRYSMETGITSPTADEIAMAAAVFRALPSFVYDEMHADSDELVPVTKIYALPAAHSGASIELSYPVEGLEIPDEPDTQDMFETMQDNPEMLDHLKQIFGDLMGDSQPKQPPENNGTWKKRK